MSCVSVATSRHRQALFSVQVIMVMGSSTNREVNMTVGEVLFSEEQKMPRSFVFQPVSFLLCTPRRHKPSSESHSIYVLQAQQNSLQSALHKSSKYIQQYVRVDQSATTHASRHERTSRVLPRAMYENFTSFFLFFDVLLFNKIVNCYKYISCVSSTVCKVNNN